MPFHPNDGMPGIGTVRTATPRRVLLTDQGKLLLPTGRVIAGAHSRDTGHAGYLDILRPGTFMGRRTTDGKWAPSFIGKVTSNYTSGGTSLTVDLPCAAEIVRRIGTSGIFKLTHAPTAGGTVVPYANVTFSAVNTGTGVLTITNIGANVNAGALVGVSDGSEVPRAIIDDGYGIKVTDADAANIDVPFPNLVIGGIVDVARLPFWPDADDTTIVTWLKAELRRATSLIFSDEF